MIELVAIAKVKERVWIGWDGVVSRESTVAHGVGDEKEVVRGDAVEMDGGGCAESGVENETKDGAAESAILSSRHISI